MEAAAKAWLEADDPRVIEAAQFVEQRSRELNRRLA
ncbi:Uncharacterised protein [Mycobacteroides abscessus subsp. abscessus]|nr:Uncharacterised protein [Mycobacteroides abscessus subsp. abscessus]SHW84909.1 Uncharacterised protein [Mycobacteroides abscessus subsp. abscessus]SHY43246.1 Uncharacterised protein [Mycobacteroides abscessus subsp. abscessus]SIB12938.1 Uncharacterised protein [Mycobacteroides abscessus subsp. abscessus]SIB39304.1 Uncharacterised protein [Mycobacteroides abscessus subsp. abscessus]